MIGLGARGREVLNDLALLPNAPVVAICDNYAPSLRRAGEMTPPRRSDLTITKTSGQQGCRSRGHRHAQPPITAKWRWRRCKRASTFIARRPWPIPIEDTKAIATAARDSIKVVFQPGLQERSHPQRHFLLPFIRAGSLGDIVMARAQSHQNNSWVSASSNPEHEKALNWRLHQATSTGLMGEIGIHQIDAVSWFLKARPAAITGFGSILRWKDGRDVADTVQGIFEFPGGVNFMYDATLVQLVRQGLRNVLWDAIGRHGARRQSLAVLRAGRRTGRLGGLCAQGHFYTETGIALVANATKQAAIGTSATAGNASPFTPLYYALEAFTANVGQRVGAVKDFIDSFGDSDPQALADSLKILKPYYPAATWQDGLDATILAIKANEAVVEQTKDHSGKGIV